MALIGHTRTKKRISQALASARARNEALPHMIFSGHPGCGKTCMAKEVAKEAGVDFLSIIPESLKTMKDITNLVESLNFGGYNHTGDRVDTINPTIIFIDEIHRLPIFGQEKLGIIMENYLMETGRPNKYYWVPYFTVIGATTLAGELSKPFLNRFKLNFLFQPYSYGESIKIIYMHARKLGIRLTSAGAHDIARRGRGVPRIMIGYLECCRDTAVAEGEELISQAVTKSTFDDLGIDEGGFSITEINILKTLYNTEKPVGLETLSVVANESSKTIRNELEPYLIQQGYIIRSGSGRVITAQGEDYLEKQGYKGNNHGRVEITADYVRD